jgi:hypothetical protein
MTAFDLLLIILAFATFAVFVTAVGALILRRRSLAAKLLAGILGGWAIYLAVGTAVALRGPQHIMSLGEDRCFDEMCFAVMGYNRTPSPIAGKSLYLVDVRISNRSRGRAQREIGRKGVLVDRAGRVYEVSRREMPTLDAEVAPGQVLNTKLIFELPDDIDYPGFALGSNLVLNPARIVIGDEDHFLHWPTVVPLD